MWVVRTQFFVPGSEDIHEMERHTQTEQQLGQEILHHINECATQGFFYIQSYTFRKEG